VIHLASRSIRRQKEEVQMVYFGVTAHSLTIVTTQPYCCDDTA